MLRLFTVAALLSQAGCTAIKSGAVLAQAEQALLEAEDARAPQQAPYEYGLADAYRDKAREEWANSDYGDAETLAAAALEMARRAIEQAEYGTDQGTLDGSPLDDEDID